MLGFVGGVAGSFSRPVVGRSTFCGSAVRVAAVRPSSGPQANMYGIFTKAMTEFKDDFPQFAKRGWGATVKAETWNGRHAMFGMLVFWITAYCKGHGLIPNPSMILDPKMWGPLADLGGGAGGIPNERAIILIAHVHVLLVSIAAAIAPFSFQDKLLLDEGETDLEPLGLIPDMKPGMTREAETWNGRLAMLGVMVLAGGAFGTGTSVIDLTNKMFGGVFF
ncbi:hypothetical protein NDN08_005704 [Rhodosorus marinus]|uniref:PSI subunit V n=1 Tax=Rhodosorus marinus TaxID=101924 RepID=A0AAV8V2C7_9RHOD|nr:hypothetical protein NDN08_005704 [Rhodosorus marinus]